MAYASFFILFLFFHLWFVRAGYGSESEADDEAATVTLSSNLGRVNRASTKSAVRLQEIGPRMTLQLVRIEKGLCSGEVLFDEFGTSSYTFSSSNFTSFSLRNLWSIMSLSSFTVLRHICVKFCLSHFWIFVQICSY